VVGDAGLTGAITAAIKPWKPETWLQNERQTR
jgi:hypothetical protein